MSPPAERDPSLPLYATAILASLALGPHGPLYWDSFGYVEGALTGRVGGLAFGRPLFALGSHAVASLWLHAHGAPRSVEPVLRACWLALAATSAPTTARLARTLGLTARGALYAGLAVAVAPAMAHASNAVLTDAPSLALTLIAFLLGARAVRPGASRASAWCAGVALGAAIGLREQACAQAAVLALMVPCAPRGMRTRVAARFMAGCAIATLLPIAYVWATQPWWPAQVRGWFAAMAHERASRTRSAHDFIAYAAWLIALGPVALAAATMAWVRMRRIVFAWPSCVVAVVAPSIAQLGLLAFYQDISYSPRYLLGALPGAIALPAALWLEGWVGEKRARHAVVLIALVLPALIATPLVRAREAPLRRAIDTLPARLANVPDGATLVTGQLCPAAALDERIGRTHDPHAPRWHRVCPGWSWPADLARELDRAPRVVVDLRDVSWVGSGQREARDEAARYVTARSERVARGEVTVWP